MHANFASGTLIVIGTVLAALGLVVAGNIPIVALGLVAVFAGGALSIAAQRR